MLLQKRIEGGNWQSRYVLNSAGVLLAGVKLGAFAGSVVLSALMRWIWRYHTSQRDGHIGIGDIRFVTKKKKKKAGSKSPPSLRRRVLMKILGNCAHFILYATFLQCNH